MSRTLIPQDNFETAEPFIPDSVMEESWQYPNTVTEHPVVDDAPVSDHIIRKPLQFKLILLVTDTPIRRTVGALGGLDGTIRRTRYAKDWLAIRRDQLFTWRSDKYGTLRNLAIESLSTTRDNRGRLIFDIRFKQIRRARSQRVDLPPRRIIEKKAKPPVNRGDQATEDKGKNEAQRASWSVGVRDFFNASF